jgi:hypothetical protein
VARKREVSDPGSGIAVFAFRLDNQQGEPTQEGEQVFLVKRRPTA